MTRPLVETEPGLVGSVFGSRIDDQRPVGRIYGPDRPKPRDASDPPGQALPGRDASDPPGQALPRLGEELDETHPLLPPDRSPPDPEHAGTYGPESGPESAQSYRGVSAVAAAWSLAL